MIKWITVLYISSSFIKWITTKVYFYMVETFFAFITILSFVVLFTGFITALVPIILEFRVLPINITSQTSVKYGNYCSTMKVVDLQFYKLISLGLSLLIYVILETKIIKYCNSVHIVSQTFRKLWKLYSVQ